MEIVAQQLEQLNTEVTTLKAEVKAAWEAYSCARAATLEAAIALAKSPEDTHLQLLHDAAKEEERLALGLHEKLEKQEEQCLVDRRGALQAMPGAGLTLREAAAQPLPLLERRLSPRKSRSKTQPRLPRTFSDILPWQDFRKRSRDLFNHLDDTAHIYPKTESRILPRGSVLSAAHECEVRGRVVIMLDSVNDIAERLNIPVQCTGGGSGRSMSFTDLVVRPTGAQSNLADLSSQILGTVEVKGDWQFSLKRGERLEDALHDPKRIEGIVQAVQQVYGDAVMDEAPLLILTNYHVTIFLKRSDNVQDKRLWASEPVWFDQTDPPARASWVHGLQQAEELHNLKQRLPRAIVPPTVQGYYIQLRPQEAQGQRQQAAAEQQAAKAGSEARRKRQRAAEQHAHEPNSLARPVRQRIVEQQAEEPSSSARPARQCTTHVSLRLQARGPSRKGYEMDSHSSLAPQPAAANLTDPGAEKTLMLSELGLTGELLGVGQYGYTLKGRSDEGEHMAVKVYDLQQHGAAAAYENEKLAYQKLEALQGKAIPHFLGSGLLLHTAAPVIVTSLEGVALAEGKRVPQKLHKPMQKALQALHNAGAAHGDVRRSNFLVSDGEVLLVDLGQTVLLASPEQKEADMQRFKAMLPFQGSQTRKATS